MDDLFLFLHLTFLAIAVIGISIADSSAMQWMRGTIDVVSRRALFNAHWIVTVGLGGLVLTGLYLFWPMREYLLSQPFFWIKMGFVIALIINSFFIEILMHSARSYTFASLSISKKIPLFVSGAISTGSWLGALTTAWLLFGWPF